MCGRYTFTSVTHLQDRYHTLNRVVDFTPNYNIPPGHTAPVIVRHSPDEIRLMIWGLIPSWAKDPGIGVRLTNARAETIDQKPSFKDSFRHRRCLIPANGFYEWVNQSGHKQPYYITTPDNQIISFAGIYSVWTDPQAKPITTFSIITTTASPIILPIHPRMPVILEREVEDQWLDPNSGINLIKSILKPYTNQPLITYPVSTAVNYPNNNSVTLTQPLP